MTVTTTGRAAYRGGASHTGYLAGFETANKLTRVLRYTFTTPADGVSKLSFTGAHLAHSASYSWGGLNWYATTSPTSHVNAGAGSASHGTLTITGNGKDYDISAAEAAVNLPANTEAYIYIFPNNSNYFLWNFANVASLNITTAAGSSTIAAITQTVETLGTLTVSLNKAVDAFRHKLTVTAGGKTLYTSELFDVSHSVTVPRSWFDGFPSTATISATATVTTYNGGTAVGTASAAVTITADDGMRPQISEGWATAAPYNIGAVVGLTGYIAGYSQAEISFDAAKLSQAAGATLASVTVTCSGSAITAAPYRTPILLGAADVVCTATDSRGRTATQTIRIEPMAYAPPALSQVQILRCTAAGVEAEDGNHYSAKATAIFSALGGQNTLTLTAAHKIQGGVYGTETALTSGVAAIIGTISPDSTYQVRITATDTLGNTATVTAKLPTRQWALKFRQDGQGAAFGKAAEHDKALEIPADWSFYVGDESLTAEEIAALKAGGSGGTADHSKLTNRDAADQHPMSAITGLAAALAEKQPKGNYLTQDNLQSATNAALAQAKASGEFDGADGAKGDKGDKGDPGKDGSDAAVTLDNIKSVLGYAPADPSKFLPLTGGALTGNLTGNHITGTWLQSTAAGHQTTPATKVPVFDSSGWLYWRSPAELKSDMHADYVLNVKDYGAKGDGATDDTAAIQSALNKGGTIYFPPGRYKTTAKLSALVPALLLFANPYPTSGSSDNETGIETGARIESYSTSGGMLVGDSVQVDGLALRAMTGFAGVLLEHDATQGTQSYPTTARFTNIRLDNGSNSVCPTAMFALKSNGNYGLVIDNVALGNKFKKQYCTYGIKLSVDSTNWANSFHFRNINIDAKSSYPLYVENTGGSGSCKNLTFENVVVQAEKFNDTDTIIASHVNCVALKNVHEVSIIGCKVWDVNSSTITGDVVAQTSCTKISVVGSDDYWSALNTLAQYKTAMATEVSASDAQYPTCNAVKKYVAANTPTITDAQVAAGIEAWMDAHSTPTTVTSKNLYNPNDSDVVDGYIQSGGNIGTSATVWTTGYISAKAGDVVYLSNNGTAKNIYFVGLYNSSKTFISRLTVNAASVTLDDNSDIAYIRVSIKTSAGAKTDPVMICLNNADLTYQAYGTYTEGGLGQYLVLSSPNGTKYTISVSDDGVLSATPV